MAFVGNSTLTIRVNKNFDCSFLCLESGPSSARLFLNFGRNNESRHHSCELINSERYMKPDKQCMIIKAMIITEPSLQ